MKSKRIFSLLCLLLIIDLASATLIQAQQTNSASNIPANQVYSLFAGFNSGLNQQQPQLNSQQLNPTNSPLISQRLPNPSGSQNVLSPLFNQNQPLSENQLNQSIQPNTAIQSNQQQNGNFRTQPQVFPPQNQQQNSNSQNQHQGSNSRFNPQVQGNYFNQNQQGFGQYPSQRELNNNPEPEINLLNPFNGQGGSRQNRSLSPEDKLINDLTTFDNNKRELCKAPRSWNGTKCVCPNKGIFLSGKCYSQVPVERARNLFSLRFINRNFDGSENNPNNPNWGARGNTLERITKPNYEDGKGEPLKLLPQPREVSNLIGNVQNNYYHWLNTYNHNFITWSQFIGNDITATPTLSNQAFNIKVPRCDPVFDALCSSKKQLNFSRSLFRLRKQIRTHINAVTSWLDASNIYGSDQATADSLRTFKEGKLKMSHGNFLPRDQNGRYISADGKVNQNILLTIMHTVFVREHNRICDNVTTRNSALTDQEVYQIARNYVIGLIQHITFDEWLPSMFGLYTFKKVFGNYTYDIEANPAIFAEFQAAALKVFDSFIPNDVYRFPPSYAYTLKAVNYKDVIENPDLINATSFNEYISGASRWAIKQKSVELIDDLRNNFIFREFTKQKTDLYALNLQRGRDMGLGSLKDINVALGLPPKTIAQTFIYSPKLKNIENLYQNPDNVDLWLALIGEQPNYYTALGDIGNQIWIMQMNRIRNGDALWYERAYPAEVVTEIKATSLKMILERNSQVTYLPYNAFMSWQHYRY